MSVSVNPTNEVMKQKRLAMNLTGVVASRDSLINSHRTDNSLKSPKRVGKSSTNDNNNVCNIMISNRGKWSNY